MHNVWLLHPWLWDSAWPWSLTHWDGLWPAEGAGRVQGLALLSTHMADPSQPLLWTPPDTAEWSTTLTMHCTLHKQLITHTNTDTQSQRAAIHFELIQSSVLCPVTWYLGTRTLTFTFALNKWGLLPDLQQTTSVTALEGKLACPAEPLQVEVVEQLVKGKVLVVIGGVEVRVGHAQGLWQLPLRYQILQLTHGLRRPSLARPWQACTCLAQATVWEWGTGCQAIEQPLLGEARNRRTGWQGGAIEHVIQHLRWVVEVQVVDALGERLLLRRLVSPPLHHLPGPAVSLPKL